MTQPKQQTPKRITFEELQNLVVSAQTIESQKIDLYTLWKLKKADDIIGPLDAEIVHSFIESIDEIPKDIDISRYSVDEWKPIFKIYEFQRRKPQVVSNILHHNPEKDSFFILKNGQKIGPFLFNEVQAQIKDKQLLYTDLASLDGGRTWMKVYEYPELDRRRDKARDLPFIPKADSFAEAKSEVRNEIKQQKETEKEDDLAQLANIGNIGEKNLERTRVFEIPFEALAENQTSKSKTVWKFVGIFSAICVSLFAIFGIFQANKSSNLFTNSNVEETSSEQKLESSYQLNQSASGEVVSDDKEGRPERQRNRKRANASESKSFSDSKIYRNAQSPTESKQDLNFDEDNTEDLFYDEEEAPVEQDSVRKRLARKTINPKKEDFEDTQYNDEIPEVETPEDPIDGEESSRRKRRIGQQDDGDNIKEDNAESYEEEYF